MSLFGSLRLTRPSYWSAVFGKTHPIDDLLCLPVLSQWSYNLQELVGGSASESDYSASVEIINKLQGLCLSGKSSQRNAGHLGVCVDAFYDTPGILPPAVLKDKEADSQAVVCFSASFDGKGVPKIKSAARSADENPKKRLGSKPPPPHLARFPSFTDQYLWDWFPEWRQ